MATTKIPTRTVRHYSAPKSIQAVSNNSDQIAVNRALHTQRKQDRQKLMSSKKVLLKISCTAARSDEEREALEVAVQLFRIAPSDYIRSAQRMARASQFAC